MSQLQLQLQQSTMASLVSARLTHSVSPQITGKQIPDTEFHLSILQQLSTSRELQGNIVPATSQVPTAGLDNQGPEAHLTHPVLAGRALWSWPAVFTRVSRSGTSSDSLTVTWTQSQARWGSWELQGAQGRAFPACPL